MSKPPQILFITSTRIGDAVLSMGILQDLISRNPDAQITIVCGKLVQSLFEGVPNLKQIIAIQKKSFHRHWFDVWQKSFQTKWDIIVDLRDSIVSRVLFANKKFVINPSLDKSKHKAEQHAQLLGLSYTPKPVLFLSEEQKEKAKQLVPDLPFILSVGPTANWAGKTWPIENFIELVRRLISPQGIFAGAIVAVIAAPSEEEDAYKLFNSIPEKQRLDLIAKGNPALAASCLARTNFYIGNDSGLMHCAAASGIPTLGLFGASYSYLYAPYGDKTMIAHTPESYDHLQQQFKGDSEQFDPKQIKSSMMVSLTVDMVERKVSELWAKTQKEAV